ncbi:MAG: YIP1 family protein [Pseudomonadota bacterium]
MKHLVEDLLRTWRAPRAVLADQFARGLGEERLLAYLLGACLLFFIATLPGAAEDAALQGLDSATPVVGARLFGFFFVAPLLLYGVAALVHLVARALGAKGSYFRARAAFFWSLFALAPLTLVLGALSTLLAPVVGEVIGYLLLAAFLLLWSQTMAEAEEIDDWRPVALTLGVLTAGLFALGYVAIDGAGLSAGLALTVGRNRPRRLAALDGRASDPHLQR